MWLRTISNAHMHITGCTSIHTALTAWQCEGVCQEADCLCKRACDRCRRRPPQLPSVYSLITHFVLGGAVLYMLSWARDLDVA